MIEKKKKTKWKKKRDAIHEIEPPSAGEGDNDDRFPRINLRRVING